MGNTPALQNRGHEYPKRTIEDKQLDGKDRPQGCILHHPDASHSPTFSKVYGKSTALPVYMSPIQPVLCSMGLHKSDETHINLPLKYGGTYDCLHRQHTCDGGVPRAGEGPPGGIYLSIDRPGVCHQHTEVTTPAQRIDYLGLLVDLTTLHLSLPGEKLYHIRSEIDQITKKSSPITARQLA